MTPEETKERTIISLKKNKELLENLLRKRDNLDFQIETLSQRIRNQERAIENK